MILFVNIHFFFGQTGNSANRVRVSASVTSRFLVRLLSITLEASQRPEAKESTAEHDRYCAHCDKRKLPVDGERDDDCREEGGGNQKKCAEGNTRDAGKLCRFYREERGQGTRGVLLVEERNVLTEHGAEITIPSSVD